MSPIRDLPGDLTASERQAVAQAKYNRSHQKYNVTIGLYSPQDDDIKGFLQDTPNMASCIKSLIRQEIKRIEEEEAAKAADDI